jgi:hypothetical protein
LTDVYRPCDFSVATVNWASESVTVPDPGVQPDPARLNPVLPVCRIIVESAFKAWQPDDPLLGKDR